MLHNILSCTPGSHSVTHTSEEQASLLPSTHKDRCWKTFSERKIAGQDVLVIIFMFNRELRMQLLSVDILKTGGYLFIASAEAGPLLCPSFASSGRWDRSNFIDYSRLLDAAFGGPVRWETMEHRKGKVPKSNKDEADLSGKHVPTQITSTNVHICMLQQVVVLAKWWALVENNEPVGLAPRLLLSFGSAGEPETTASPNSVVALLCHSRKKFSARR